ncbi:MAG: hypothetical protein JXR83_04060 [Deltaproteobacteria bacterium]|nr:hypothetical protein [Deltaproteobacteria bacterium]
MTHAVRTFRWLVSALLLALPATGLGQVTPPAAAAGRVEAYGIAIRIISAQPTAGGIDPALQRYAADFKAMPYKSFKLLDQHSKELRKGETVSMQFPGPGRRFLSVKANGTKGGKLGFSLAIDALNFKTTVRIPDNGTLIVGGPRHEQGVILLAITAHRQGGDPA